MKRSCLLLAFSTVLAGTASGQSRIDAWKRAFRATENSWEQRALVEELDPTNPEDLAILCRFVVKTQGWYLREAGIDVLAKTLRKRRASGDVFEALKNDPSATVREATVLACGQTRRSAYLPWIRGQLDHPKWIVRRAASRALRSVRSKRGVADLVELWQHEERGEVRLEIAATLRRLTNQRDLVGPSAWAAWWAGAKDRFRIRPEQVWRRPEPTWVTIDGVRLGYHHRGVGEGLPILVLPDLGYSTSYLEDSLAELEGSRQLFYVTLPAVGDFSDPALHGGGGPPVYPLERVVDALEKLQAKLVADGVSRERFAVLAHGGACWVAMTYASRHERSVRRMILVAAQSGTTAAINGLRALEAHGEKIGDRELVRYAQSRLVGDDGKARYEPSSPEEASALDRKSFTSRFIDYRSPYIGWALGPLAEPKQAEEHPLPTLSRPLGCTLPRFSLFDLPRTKTPTLILWGAFAVETTEADARAIARHYGKNARALTLKGSREMPFLEESSKFTDVVTRFCKLSGPKPPRSGAPKTR